MFQRFRREVFALPLSELRILNGKLRQFRRLAVCKFGIYFPDFVKQDAHGPAIGDDVVHDEHKDVIGRAKANKHRPKEGPRGQVEAFVPQFFRQPQRFPFAIRLGEFTYVQNRQLEFDMIVDDLIAIGRLDDEPRSQRGMTYHQPVQRLGQRTRVQWANHTDNACQIVG
jgi:hypothetical protein